MASVQERIKRLNQLNSGAAAPQHSQHVSVHNRGQSLSKPNAASTTLSKDKSHLFKTAKLIQKSFSTDSADGEAPFLSSPNNLQRPTQHEEETKNIPSNDPNPIHASLSIEDEDDGELDAAAAMSYWRNRGGKGNNNNNNQKEAREISAPTKLTIAANQVNRTPAPVTKPAANGRLSNSSSNLQAEKEPVVVPLSPPRLQHMQPPKSTFNQDVFDSRNVQQPAKAEEGEAPFDVTAAISPRSANHYYTMSPRTAPTLISVKSSETVLSGATSVLSGATDASGVSTLSLRAKKFLKEKRKNGPILTGRSRGNANNLGAETNMKTATSILQEKAAKDRLKKRLAETKATKPQHIAVGKMNDAVEHSTMRPISVVGKRDELGANNNITRGADITQGKYITIDDDIAQIKADAPFDEPIKDGNTEESRASSNQLQNFAFASIDKAKINGLNNKSPQRSKPKRSKLKKSNPKKSPLSDVIRVTQQDKSAYSDNDGSLSEFTNQSDMNSMTNKDSVISTDASQLSSKASLRSDLGRKTYGQKKNYQPEPAVPKAEEDDIIEALADAGCQVFEAFGSLANVIMGRDEYAKNTNVPFDEDVAIEVEYVDQKY